MEFSRPEYWSGYPFPSPGDLPDPGIKPESLMSPALAGGFFTTCSTWGFPDSSVGKESTCSAGDPSLIPGSGWSAGEGIGYPLQYSWASLVAQLKESVCNAGELGSILGLGRSPGEGKGYLLQYSGLENSMNYIVHGVTKSQTQLSDFRFTSVPPGKLII